MRSDSVMERLSSPVNLVVALPLEAAPIIDKLDMAPLQSNSSFSCYSNGTHNLIVSGMGRTYSAAATGYLAARSAQEYKAPPVWINFGIAGHQWLEIGSVALINKVTTCGGGDSSYPLPLPLSPNLLSSELITVDKPEQNYPESAAYDMEGAGFWVAANKFSPLEFVQLLKVISDNPDHGIEKFNKNKVSELVVDALPALESTISQLAELALLHNSAQSMPESYDVLLDNYRFTVTQIRQLRKLCQRFTAAGIGEELEEFSKLDCGSAKQLLSRLNTRLENLVI